MRLKVEGDNKWVELRMGKKEASNPYRKPDFQQWKKRQRHKKRWKKRTTARSSTRYVFSLVLFSILKCIRMHGRRVKKKKQTNQTCPRFVWERKFVIKRIRKQWNQIFSVEWNRKSIKSKIYGHSMCLDWCLAFESRLLCVSSPTKIHRETEEKWSMHSVSRQREKEIEKNSFNFRVIRSLDLDL